MRVAVLADIHGNLQALEAVLADLERESPDLVVVAGDIVNRCVQPREVLERLEAVDHFAIHGNADLNVAHASDLDWDYDWPPMAEIGIFFKEQIGEGWARYLRKLPDHCYLDVARETDVLIAHGIPGNPFRGIVSSPERERQFLGRGDWPLCKLVPPEELHHLAATIPANIFVTAHTHRQYVRQVDEVTVVNPGTVAGQHTFVDGRLQAEYMILTWNAGVGDWSFDFKQIPFDVEETIRHLERMRGKLPGIEWVINFYSRKKDEWIRRG